MTETLLHVTVRTRGPARLDDPELDAPDPSIDALVRRCESLTSVVLVGGEPTHRADLPALLAALPAPTLRTDALALASPYTLRDLRAAGMQRLRVVLHSARPEAHDWLVAQPGAARRAMRVLLAAAELGIPTEIEATLTRPTAPHIAELVVLAEGVHARAVHLVRIAHRGLAARDAIMLVPRFALLEDPIDDAAGAAIRARITLALHGFPPCVAVNSKVIAAPDARAHAVVDDKAWASVRDAYAVRYADRCPSCPGLPACAGAAADYVARFGSLELASEQTRIERAHVDAPTDAAPKSVAARAGRAPITRLRDVRTIIRRGAVEGDPLIDRAEEAPDALRISFAPIDTSTRVLRARLIRAAQEGARVLYVTGGLDHPAASALLRECARLPGVSVEIAGNLAPLFTMTDADLFEIEGITRAMAALHDPSEIDTATTFLDRAMAIAKIASRRYVVLRSIEDAARWTDAFARIGDDAFVRLAGAGDLDALTEFAAKLPTSRYKDALAQVLPLAHFASTVPRTITAPPAFVDAIVHGAAIGDDEPFGAFDACACGLPRCPGIARDWATTGRDGHASRFEPSSGRA